MSKCCDSGTATHLFASVASHILLVYCLNVPDSFYIFWYPWSVGNKHTAPSEVILVTVCSRGQNSLKMSSPVGAETPMQTIGRTFESNRGSVAFWYLLED